MTQILTQHCDLYHLCIEKAIFCVVFLWHIPMKDSLLHQQNQHKEKTASLLHRGCIVDMDSSIKFESYLCHIHAFFSWISVILHHNRIISNIFYCHLNDAVESISVSSMPFFKDFASNVCPSSTKLTSQVSQKCILLHHICIILDFY